ncbi:MAG: hypothetical protein IJW79_12320 [Clostridia bacterium]|nr:hypothetical protein [Clostridia bacterium]
MKRLSLILVAVLLVVSSLLCVSCAKAEDKAVLKGYEDAPFVEYLEKACEKEAQKEGIKASYSVKSEEGWKSAIGLNSNYLSGSQKPVTYTLEVKISEGQYSENLMIKFFMIFDTDTNLLDVAGGLIVEDGEYEMGSADDVWGLIDNMFTYYID